MIDHFRGQGVVYEPAALVQCMEMTRASAGSTVWAVGVGVRRVGLHA